MQLTKLDRWLKERFIYETHIFVLRLPEEKLPRGVKVQEVAAKKSGDYTHKLMMKDNDLAEYVIQMLKDNSLMYATHVVEGKHWYNKRIAPDGKSFTLMWFNRFLLLMGICSVIFGLNKLRQNEKVAKIIEDSINELKGGL